MILQLKHMPIVMNIRPESPRVTGNPRNAMICDTPYLQNEFGDPRFFFYVFNLILSFSTCSQSFKKICAWELLGANVLNSSYVTILFCSNKCTWLLPCGETALLLSHNCLVSSGGSVARHPTKLLRRRLINAQPLVN